MQEKILLTGATGFIGKNLCEKLLEENYELIILTRNPEKIFSSHDGRIRPVKWDGRSTKGWSGYIEGTKAVINLAGENIASGRWTPEIKRSILESRINATNAVVEAIEKAENKPEIFVQASAIGYYGSRDEEEITESASAGSGFLSEIVRRWEEASQPVDNLGIRRVITRIGMVLGKGGGALQKMITPFNFFLGGPVGDGTQWYSWIHIDDASGAVTFLIRKKKLSGVFNLTAPNPVRNREFAAALGRAMNRPYWLGAPEYFIKAIYGQMGEEVLLSGKKVIPEKLIKSGYEFKFSDVEKALRGILM